MNDYFTAYWAQLRHIEGASQRVQDDTMRFSRTMEGLGVNLIDSIMTLIAFLPVLAALSVHVTALPLVGAIPYPLVIAAVCLVDLRHGAAGRRRREIAGPRVPQPARRGGLSQGTGLWRGRRKPRSTGNAAGAVRQCAQELLHALLELRLFRRDALSLPPIGRGLCDVPSGAHHRGRKDHARPLPADRLRRSRKSPARSSIWSIPGRRSWS